MMASPDFLGVTLTGVDEFTPFDDIQALGQMPGVELAFLYSLDALGSRFVSLAWLLAVLPRLRCRAALHVCGGSARRQLLDGELGACMPWLGRVQVNGPVGVGELQRLADAVPQLITQHDAYNEPLARVHAPGHALLVDGSGGLGILPARWQRPETDKPVGFAGGLSLGNLPVQWGRIASAATGPWWIDLETGLRSKDDRFDAVEARRVADLVASLAAAGFEV